MIKPLGPEGIRKEIERLGNGGDYDEALLNDLTTADRICFEIGVMDALTAWPRADQRRLRAALIKHGYDELCARRMTKGDTAEQVRAATLHRLLRPQATGELTTDFLTADV